MQSLITRTGLILALAATAVSAGAFAQAASPQGPEDFYRGKTIDFVIGYPPGGSNDVWGRLVGRHIGNHIPGKPNVVPKNMPGAGSFLAVNQIFNVLAKDGTVIGIAAPTIPLDEKLGTQGVRFKTAELNWTSVRSSLPSCIRRRSALPSSARRECRRIALWHCAARSMRPWRTRSSWPMSRR